MDNYDKTLVKDINDSLIVGSLVGLTAFIGIDFLEYYQNFEYVLNPYSIVEPNFKDMFENYMDLGLGNFGSHTAAYVSTGTFLLGFLAKYDKMINK